ncbi:hypothetical protein ERC79_17350 [Rhodococcus sp. ABRD24]|uniref:hypothetical protein n=1 Tax=Rhodococcus sp. ABRD24 TaxID=2507582 RepID=UPI00103ACDE1|nr:hypothetical protein [Rhodococcus sp. ABRD24]QBJ97509.1 hypothetical protein ERC79_17350 [Rhodococcus sp. ABRD24]
MGNSSKRVRPSACALVGSGVAFVLATSWLLLTAPGQLPSHFEGSGEITEWMSIGQYVTVTSAFTLGTALICGGARWYIPKIPDRALNLTGSQSNYWARPENRNEFDTKIIVDVEWIGVLITLTILGVTCLACITAAGVHIPFWIRPTTTVLPMLALLGYIGYVSYSGRYSPPSSTTRHPRL